MPLFNSSFLILVIYVTTDLIIEKVLIYAPCRNKGRGKAKKKKWSKGKTSDKLNNLVLFDKPTYEKLLKEVPTYKLITPSIVSERLKVRGSLARKALDELTAKGLIRQVVQHHAQTIYTRVIKDEADE